VILEPVPELVELPAILEPVPELVPATRVDDWVALLGRVLVTVLVMEGALVKEALSDVATGEGAPD